MTVAKKFIIYIFFFTFYFSFAAAEFFKDISDIIENNEPRLSYGVAVSDVNNDNKFEFVVTGFGYKNLALGFENNNLVNTIDNEIFNDTERKTIGVAACDIDKDGFEEVYFLNTDTYSGDKKYSDRLLDKKQKKFFDLFEIEKNKTSLNLTAGRSVVCVDRNGNGVYGFYVANYGGPTRFYELNNNLLIDKAPKLKIDRVTGGRAVVAGHIISDNTDIFAANERGSNFLYKNNNGSFTELANKYEVQDKYENGRGTTLSDVFYRGQLDIVSSNWNGNHRIFALDGNEFRDIAQPDFNEPTRIRTVISADFDNDGFDEIFMNNIGQPNKLFKILDNGVLKKIDIQVGLEYFGLGTGAAVADIDNDGILELLVAHGESGMQPLSLYKADIKEKFKYIRIQPLNKFGAPARGATVTLISNLRKHSKTIDAGSGYLCQMEPVAHFGLRKGEKIRSLVIQWTNGQKKSLKISKINKTIKVKQ
ncbi:CRTAC1 family protein [Candidatus Pelagibacter sp.]|nr:CRTAC1 family protein [Candidatus Pelagibacter sp.]